MMKKRDVQQIQSEIEKLTCPKHGEKAEFLIENGNISFKTCCRKFDIKCRRVTLLIMEEQAKVNFARALERQFK